MVEGVRASGIGAAASLPNGSVRIANIAIAPLVTRNFVAVGRIILVDDITDRGVAALLDQKEIKPIQKQAALRGIADKIVVYEIP